MIRSDIFREKSPLSSQDCFVVFDRRKSSFTFPVHIHPEYELNYVQGAVGAKRIVGDSVETVGEKDLVLITNPELKHAWMDGEDGHQDIHDIITRPSSPGANRQRWLHDKFPRQEKNASLLFWVVGAVAICVFAVRSI